VARAAAAAAKVVEVKPAVEKEAAATAAAKEAAKEEATEAGDSVRAAEVSEVEQRAAPG
jgi:hypothetical protein